MRIGIDIGGTKTEVIALDDMGKCLLRRRVGTPANDYSAVLSTPTPAALEEGHRLQQTAPRFPPGRLRVWRGMGTGGSGAWVRNRYLLAPAPGYPKLQ
jgi:fructokinase